MLTLHLPLAPLALLALLALAPAEKKSLTMQAAEVHSQ
jgi:hypothetical protein